jgi:hypothetical protein
MAIAAEPRSRSTQRMPLWAKGIVVLLATAFYVWAALTIRSASEDKHSHAIRISLPLLPGQSWIADPGENFDPAKADWGNLTTGVVVADGQVVFVRTSQGDYALRLFDQSLQPEQAKYQFARIGSKDSVHEGVTNGDRPISLPGQSIQWSGASPGHGFLYLGDNIVFGSKSLFQFGGPFPTGDVKQFQDNLPPGIQFSPLAWKLDELNGVKFDDQGFLR